MTSYWSADGTYYERYVATITTPVDTRYAGCVVILKYTGGPRNGQFEELVTIPHAGDGTISSAEFVWRPPTGSQTSRWYFVSYNKRGQRNTIQDPGVTPYIDKTVGNTSQFDFTQVKLDSISDQFRIDPLTGLPTIYQLSSLLLTDQLQVGGGTINGQCDTATSGSDTTIHALSGTPFTSGMVGTYFYVKDPSIAVIKMATMKVKTFTDSTHIVLAGVLGTAPQSNVAWSYGRPPQAKFFDRNNVLIGFLGDDSYNTGYVGLFFGKSVRLGGNIATGGLFEVDSSTGDIGIGGTSGARVIDVTPSGTTINGAPLTLSLSGATITLDDIGHTGTPQNVGMKIDTGAGPNHALLSAFNLYISYTGGTATQLDWNGLVALDSSGNSAVEVLENGGITVFGGRTIRAGHGTDVITIDPSTIEHQSSSVSQFKFASGKLTHYAGHTTVGAGVPSILDRVAWGSAQTASIGATNLLVDAGTPPSGSYRLLLYIAASTAGSGGSATLTISFNDGIAARTFSLVAAFGSLVWWQQALVIHSDGSGIQYSVTYTGTGGAAYKFAIEMERLGS